LVSERHLGRDSMVAYVRVRVTLGGACCVHVTLVVAIWEDNLTL
jgi:hypothetical protein